MPARQVHVSNRTHWPGNRGAAVRPAARFSVREDQFPITIQGPNESRPRSLASASALAPLPIFSAQAWWHGAFVAGNAAGYKVGDRQDEVRTR
jgi:hypothetical protein